MECFEADLESFFENCKTAAEEDLREFIENSNHKLLSLSSNNIEDIK